MEAKHVSLSKRWIADPVRMETWLWPAVSQHRLHVLPHACHVVYCECHERHFTSRDFHHDSSNAFLARRIWYALYNCIVLEGLSPFLTLLSSPAPYRIKLDRWPCHVTFAKRKACFFIGFNAVTRHGIYFLGHKVDLIRNVTPSRFRILAVNFTLLLFLNRFWTLLMFLKSLSFRFGP